MKTIKSLESKKMIQYSEYDVRYLPAILAAGAIKTGKIEKDEYNICHPDLRGKPYLMIDGVEYSPAIGLYADTQESAEELISDSLFIKLCENPFTPKQAKQSKQAMLDILRDSYSDYKDSCSRASVDPESFRLYVTNPFECFKNFLRMARIL